MLERDFAAQLKRLYREPRRLADEDEFFSALQLRLERERRQRRGVLAVCGALGGSLTLSALWQVNVAGWVREWIPGLIQPLHGVIESIDTTHMAALGITLVAAAMLRELARIMSDTH